MISPLESVRGSMFWTEAVRVPGTCPTDSALSESAASENSAQRYVAGDASRHLEVTMIKRFSNKAVSSNIPCRWDREAGVLVGSGNVGVGLLGLDLRRRNRLVVLGGLLELLDRLAEAL